MSVNLIHALDALRHNVAVQCIYTGMLYSDYLWFAKQQQDVPTMSPIEYNAMRAKYDV